MGAVADARAGEVRGEIALPYHGLLLVAAFAAAVVAQGGYYLPGRIMAAVLVAAAVVLARPRVNVVVWLGGVLALWALTRGLLAGNALAAVPTITATAVFVGAVLVAAKADLGQRELLATIVVWVGALVGVTGWVAVVARIPSWSVVAEGLFRASSTLTYPNSAAALLAASAVLAMMLKSNLPVAAAGFLACTGLAATMSRAGVIALAAGLVVLCLFRGFKETVRTAAPPLLGAAIAMGALLPTMRQADEPRPLVAVLGLVVGALVALGLPRLKRAQAPVAAAIALAMAYVAYRASSGLASRITFASPDRSGATGAALDMVKERPIIGVGPGQANFFFNQGNLGTRVMRYVHNEYLQVLVELGGVGLVSVLGVLVAVLVMMWRGRTGEPLWAGACAAFVVVLVHSGFDFLWHLPVLLIIGGVAAGLGFPSTKDGINEGVSP